MTVTEPTADYAPFCACMQLPAIIRPDSAGDLKMEKEFCDWTSLDLSAWLGENGLPQDICETFEGKFVSWQCHDLNREPKP